MKRCVSPTICLLLTLVRLQCRRRRARKIQARRAEELSRSLDAGTAYSHSCLFFFLVLLAGLSLLGVSRRCDFVCFISIALCYFQECDEHVAFLTAL